MCGAVAYPGPLRVSVLPSPNQFITDTYTTMFEERLSVSYIYDSCSSRESYQCAVNAGELNLTAAGSTDCGKRWLMCIQKWLMSVYLCRIFKWSQQIIKTSHRFSCLDLCNSCFNFVSLELIVNYSACIRIFIRSTT